MTPDQLIPFIFGILMVGIPSWFLVAFLTSYVWSFVGSAYPETDEAETDEASKRYMISLCLFWYAYLVISLFRLIFIGAIFLFEEVKKIQWVK